MDAQKVDMFIMTNGKYFAEEKISFIRTRLLELDDSKWAQISSLQFKSPTVALVLSIFLGGYGIDRFLYRSYRLGSRQAAYLRRNRTVGYHRLVFDFRGYP